MHTIYIYRNHPVSSSSERSLFFAPTHKTHGGPLGPAGQCSQCLQTIGASSRPSCRAVSPPGPPRKQTAALHHPHSNHTDNEPLLVMAIFVTRLKEDPRLFPPPSFVPTPLVRPCTARRIVCCETPHHFETRTYVHRRHLGSRCGKVTTSHQS